MVRSPPIGRWAVAAERQLGRRLPTRIGRALARPLQGILLAVFLLTLPAFADWTSFRGDAGADRRGRPRRCRASLKPLWTFEAADGFEGTAAIVGGTVYVGSLDGHLYALDLATGKLRWKYTAGGEIKSSPAVAGGMVYFGDETGTFHAVDAATGKAALDVQDRRRRHLSPTISGRRPVAVLFGSYDGTSTRLDDRRRRAGLEARDRGLRPRHAGGGGRRW